VARDIAIRPCANMDRRLERLADPKLFLTGYFVDRFWRPFAKDQEKAIEIIVTCARTGADEIIAAPRGDWKTETAKALLIYLMLAEVCRFPVIFGATASDAEEKFRDIKQAFERAELSADFPEVCDPIIALDGAPSKAGKQTFQGHKTRMEWTATGCTLPHVVEVPGTGQPSPYGGVAFSFRGLDGRVRGMNVGGIRPDFALLDDIETSDSARSMHQIATRTAILDKDVGGLGTGGERIPRVVIGTVQNDFCLTNVKLKEWGGQRFKAVYQWPARMDLWQEYVELRRREKADGDKEFTESHTFYASQQQEMDRDAELGNPYRVSRKKRADGTPRELSALQNVFNDWADKGEAYVMTELQNDPPASMQMETMGLTTNVVRSRISGLEQHELPEETECYAMAIDLGRYMCHWVGAGFVQGFTGWIADYGVVEVHNVDHSTSQEASEMALYRSLMAWRNQIMSLPRVPDVVGIDSGTFTNIAYQFVRDVGGEPFRVVKGSGTSQFRHGTPSPTRIVGDHWYASFQAESSVWLVMIDSDFWKQFVQQRFLTEVFDEAHQFNAGSLSLYAPGKTARGEYNTRTHLSFAQHIVSEELRTEFIVGKGLVSKWYQTNRNNHWLDATYMMCAMARLMGINFTFDSPHTTAAPHSRPRRNTARGITGPGGTPYLVTQRK